MTTGEPDKSFWSTGAGVLTAVAAFVTAIATLIGALAAAGVFEGDPGPKKQEQVAAGPDSNSSGSQRTPQIDPVVGASNGGADPDRVSVDLVYAGDYYGCSLQFTVDIGGQTAHPTGNRFTIKNVPTGPQSYAIQGGITCASVGSCAATGSGVVDVAEDAEYNVTWLNTAYGQCDVTLA
jgi:hypothetical protein